MKRATALRYAREIARRLHEVNGLLATPVCKHEAVRVRRVWVFGSTAKGAENPNDLDVMIELDCMVGRHKTWQQTTIDKEARKRFGVRVARDNRTVFLKWLTKGMRGVSRHCRDMDGVVLDVQTLIYPRYDLEPAE